MKKYIINLIIFLLPLCVVFLILEICIRNYSTVMKQKQTYLSENSEAIEVLILGNSHSGDGLNPNVFSLHTFNAAQGSQSLYFDIEIAKKYLPRMKQLKYVLISIDYHSLYFTNLAARDFMYDTYYDITYKESITSQNNFSLLFQGYGFSKSLKMLVTPPLKTNKGWLGYETTDYSALTDVSGKNRVQIFDDIIKKNKHEKKEIIANLNSFIRILKSKNIEPILYTLPCHPFYIKNLDSTIVTQNNIDVKNICKQHSIKYLNYLYENIADSCFYNIDHLNVKGALPMSKKLNKEILLIEKSKIRKLNNK